MNKKLVQTDFLNPLYHPVKMNIVLNKTVKPPPFAPRNPNKEPMPKYGHIQFGETAARTMDVFNNKRKYVALQDPRKMYQTEPMPVGKFLNAGTVKRINMGRVAKFYSGVKLVSKIEAPIINVMKDSNMKLITLEMLKNAITGVKYDKALGTQQQQLQAKTAYDNLIVQYSALVDRKLDTPQEVKNIINAYERELEKIYGRDILKKAPEKQIETLTASINTIKGSLENLYDLISTGKISDPRLLLQQEREAEEEIPELEELSERQLRSMSQNQRAEYLQRLSEQRSKSRSEERIQGEEEKTQIRSRVVLPANIDALMLAQLERIVSAEKAPPIVEQYRQETQDEIDRIIAFTATMTDHIDDTLYPTLLSIRNRLKKASYAEIVNKLDSFKLQLQAIAQNVRELEKGTLQHAKLLYAIRVKGAQNEAFNTAVAYFETEYGNIYRDAEDMTEEIKQLQARMDAVIAKIKTSPSKKSLSTAPSTPPSTAPSTPPSKKVIQQLAEEQKLEDISKQLIAQASPPPTERLPLKKKYTEAEIRRSKQMVASKKHEREALEQLRDTIIKLPSKEKDTLIERLKAGDEPENFKHLQLNEKDLIIEELQRYEKTKQTTKGPTPQELEDIQKFLASKKQPPLVNEPPPSLDPAVPYDKIPEVWANKYGLNANPTLKDLTGVLTITDLNEIARMNIPPENLVPITQAIYENILQLKPVTRKIIYDVFRASFIKRSKGKHSDDTVDSSINFNLRTKEDKSNFDNNLAVFLKDETTYLTPYVQHIPKKLPSQASETSGIPPYLESVAEAAPFFGQGRRRRKSKAKPKSKKITHKNIRKMQDEIMRVLKG
jgi:hypothetical protein